MIDPNKQIEDYNRLIAQISKSVTIINNDRINNKALKDKESIKLEDFTRAKDRLVNEISNDLKNCVTKLNYGVEYYRDSLYLDSNNLTADTCPFDEDYFETVYADVILESEIINAYKYWNTK